MKVSVIFLFLFLIYTVTSDCGNREKRSSRSDSFSRNINRPVKNKGLLERTDSEEVNDEDEPDCIGSDGNGFAERIKNAVKKLNKRMRQLFGYSTNEPDEIDIRTDDDEEDSESFYERVLGSLQPWWKGRNVCKREEEKRLPPGESDSSSIFSFFRSNCVDTGRSYKCSMKTKKNNTNIVRTLIYECCFGYSRKSDEKGCPQKLDLKPAVATLQKLNLTRLLEFLESTGLATTLEIGANFTIFAPTNDAIDRPKHNDEISVVVFQTNDKMHFARDLLSGHILKQRLGLDEMEDEQVYQTAKTGVSLRTNFYTHNKPMVTVNCAKVISVDNQATNGIVHIVDRVLTQPSQTLAQMLEEDPRFSVFLSMMDENTKNLLALELNHHYTVFAFTNDVFESLPQKTKERFKAKHSCLANVIKQHIIPHTICTEAIQGRSQAFTLSGLPLLLNRVESENLVYANGKKLTIYDRMATNGVLHMVDGVITYVQNDDVVDALDKIGYTTVVSALRETGLAEDVEKLKTVGLFLPPRFVFENFSSISTRDKRLLLQNHIVERSQFAPYRRDVNVHTAAGNTYQIAVTNPHSFSMSFGPPKRTIGCAKFTSPPITTCNGVIQYIDRILPIPKHNVLDLIRSRPDLSVFTTLVEASGLDQQLISNEDDSFTFTLFVPDNAAMERSFNPDSQRNLLNDMTELKNFVKRHIVDDRVCCHNLESESWFDETTVLTEAGTRVKSRGIETEEIVIGRAKIKRCNLEGTNGLVHIVDRPMPSPRRFFGLLSGDD